MSKNINIQEGGIAKQLTANKLKTNLVGGGTCLWVPEDETILGTKTVTENGTYKASDDGYYGYSEVTVSGIGSVTGTDPTTGEDTTVTTGPTGELETTVLPHSIKVETPPTVTTYADGATIDFSGMVVKAYLKSGGVWSDAAHPNGIIPISELMLPVTTASKDESKTDEWSDGAGVTAMLISYTQKWDLDWQGRDYQVWVSQAIGEHEGLPAMWGGNGPTQFFATIFDGDLYVFGSTAARALNGYTYDASKEYGKYRLFVGTSESSGTGEVMRHNLQSWVTGIPTSTSIPTGSEDLQPKDATQTIPVQWTRPGDYKTLESSFNITVT